MDYNIRKAYPTQMWSNYPREEMGLYGPIKRRFILEGEAKQGIAAGYQTNLYDNNK